MTVRVPSTLTRASSAGEARRFVVPATWKTRSTPRSALRSAARSPSCAVASSTSSPSSASRDELARTVARTSSPRASSARTTCEPTNPVAPVTSVRPTPPIIAPTTGRAYRFRAMPNVAVVTDTTHYLPREVIQRHGIREVSLYVRWGDPPADQREADMPDFDAFYDHLRSSRDLPTTSQPSVGDFLEVYEPLIEQGADIVSLHLSGGISGTVRSAEQARDQLVERGVAPERITIVDSGTVCAGLGLMALAAANAAGEGADAAGVTAAARALREEMKILFAVDTLEFLRRGGRIGGAQAWIGSTLRIKPILAIESEVVPVERVRTWGRAFERMVDHLQSLRDDGADRFYVQHIQAPDQAEKLAQRGEAIYGRPPDIVSEMGPVIGTHAGPGLIGVTALRGELVGPL